MESQAVVLKWQAAEIENAPDLALQVANDVFIPDIQRETGSNLLPVIHQALILQIVFTQFSEVVTEWLTTCKKLFIGPKTAIQRMTRCIDDLGAGKC